MDYLWETTDDYETKLSLSLASGQYPDVLKCDFETFQYLKDSGALADLSDVWEEYASDTLKAAYAEVDDDIMQFVMDGDQLLAIPYVTSRLQTMKCTYYRADWLKNLGLEVPTTIDELTEVIKAFRDNDPDGNGEQDTYGLSLYSEISTLYSYMYAFGSYPGAWYEKDGEIVYGTISDETKEALDWLRGLYAEGYIDPEFGTLSYDQYNANLSNGSTGIVSGGWYTPDAGFVKNSIENCNTAEWAVGGIVGKEEGEIGKTTANENVITGYNVVLSTASEDAKIAMIKMLNVFYDAYFHSDACDTPWEWWQRDYDPESEEYKEIYENYGAWWIPVNAWAPNGTYEEYVAMTYYYENEELADGMSLSVEYMGNADNAREYLNKDVSELEIEEDITNYAEAWRMATTRIDSEKGQCSLGLLSQVKEEGNYLLSVHYGNSTETELMVSSTLKDYWTEYFIKYIMGTESEDSWDEFVSGWLSMGGEQWIAEVNEAYAALH